MVVQCAFCRRHLGIGRFFVGFGCGIDLESVRDECLSISGVSLRGAAYCFHQPSFFHYRFRIFLVMCGAITHQAIFGS